MQQIILTPPPFLKDALTPISEWIKQQQISDTLKDWPLFYLGLQRSMAPKSWKIGIATAGFYDPQRPLPTAPLENIPYDLTAVSWALNNLQKPKADIALINSIRVAVEVFKWTGAPLSYFELLLVGLYQYPKFTNGELKQQLHGLLTHANTPSLGRVLLYGFPSPLLPRPAVVSFVPTSLVAPAGVGSDYPLNNLLLSDIGQLAIDSIVPLMRPLERQIAQGSAKYNQMMFGHVSRFLANLLRDRGTAANIPPDSYRLSNQDFFWNTPEVMQAVKDSLSLFQSYSDLVRLLITFGHPIRQRPIALMAILARLPLWNAQNYQWLKSQIADKWSGTVWTGILPIEHSISPHAVSRRQLSYSNLVAIYSVAAQWYKFEPQLQLYLYPEQGEIIENFWDSYGESIMVLQELAAGYRVWLQSKSTANPASLQELSNVCPSLVGRLADSDNVDRLRRQLLELQQNAEVTGVPLRFLFDTSMPQISLDDFDAQVSKAGLAGLRSSLWWFDVLRLWWDSFCQQSLGERLGEIVQSNYEFGGREYQINSVVGEALIAFAQKFGPQRKRRAGLAVIKKSNLSESMKNEATLRFDTIIDNADAVNQLHLFDSQVRGGQLPIELARSDLEDLIKQYSYNAAF
jgi:hypothetical protein